MFTRNYIATTSKDYGIKTKEVLVTMCSGWDDTMLAEQFVQLRLSPEKKESFDNGARNWNSEDNTPFILTEMLLKYGKDFVFDPLIGTLTRKGVLIAEDVFDLRKKYPRNLLNTPIDQLGNTLTHLNPQKDSIDNYSRKRVTIVNQTK